LGKIVKGAGVAQETYLLKPPSIAPGHPKYAPELTPAFSSFVEDVNGAVDLPQPVDLDATRIEAAALIDKASADAEALLNDAHQRALELVNDAVSRTNSIEAEARQNGYDRGLADGRNAAQAEMDEMLSTMRGLVEMARTERHKIIEAAEPEIVRLATAIAERILHQHVASDPNAVLDMTRAAITRLVNRETVTVRVNPADIETMRENRDTIMSMNDIEHLRVIEDQRVDRGGVVLETESGTIDAKVSTQLREVRRLLHVEEQLSIPPACKETLLSPPAQAS
jgi:flagellar biosynthesis/type III secretory pathway protein FliH